MYVRNILRDCLLADVTWRMLISRSGCNWCCLAWSRRMVGLAQLCRLVVRYRSHLVTSAQFDWESGSPAYNSSGLKCNDFLRKPRANVVDLLHCSGWNSKAYHHCWVPALCCWNAWTRVPLFENGWLYLLYLTVEQFCLLFDRAKKTEYWVERMWPRSIRQSCKSHCCLICVARCGSRSERCVLGKVWAPQCCWHWRRFNGYRLSISMFTDLVHPCQSS